jgi:type II restriction enzyme
MALTASDLVNFIAQLDKSRVYEYPTGNTSIVIADIVKPEGPINCDRFDRNGNKVSPAGISSQMLTRMAVACSNNPYFPIHIDRLFSAGGNARSALEALLLYAPHFFLCYPERVDVYTGETRRNLKHIMWCPDDSHKWGEIAEIEYEGTVTEVDLGLSFGNINLDPAQLDDDLDSIDAKRVHTQMQVALVEIGRALDFETWIARNDRSIEVGGEKLGDMRSVIESLDDVAILYSAESKRAASLIDCIWFSDERNRIPAVIEIEHSTGVTSGLTRMLKFREVVPAISTTFTIVAPNDLRNKVVTEANQPIYKNLQARYMPYSTVRELYGLIQRYSLSGAVDYKFINPFMEEIVGQ